MPRRFYESTAGATGGCVIQPNRYNEHEYFDLNDSPPSIMYQGRRIPIQFSRADIIEYTSSIGFAPHRATKRIEHWRSDTDPRAAVALVYLIGGHQSSLAYILFHGKEYRLLDQSPLISVY